MADTVVARLGDLNPPPNDADGVLATIEKYLRSRAAKTAKHIREDLAFQKAVEDLDARRTIRQEKFDAAVGWIDSQIATLMETARELTGARSWSLPHGKVGFRKQPARFHLDGEDAPVIEWLGALPVAVWEANEDPRRTKTTVHKPALYALVKAIGELPPGVAEIPEGETLSITADLSGGDADLLVAEEDEEGAA